MKKKISYSAGFVLLLLLSVPGISFGQNFVYQPLDPAFGGSYLNYSWLLSSANAQNPYKGGKSFSFFQNPLENFQRRVQRQVLGQLTQQIIRNVLEI